MGIKSALSHSTSTTRANSPSFEAAARRTIGVSSWQKIRKVALNSALTAGETLEYATLNNPQAEVRDVNQSPDANLLRSGIKYVSRSAALCCSEIRRSDSTALSRTTVSSTVASDSRGG